MGAALDVGSACCPANAKDDPGMAQLLLKYEELNMLTLKDFESPSKGSCDGCLTVRDQQQFHDPNLIQKVDTLIGDLFCLQDLNADGILDEVELVKLNEKIAMLHYGKDIDKTAVKEKYRTLFREQLDADGCGVPDAIFRRYIKHVLDEVDPDPASQEMILEQFINEARSGRELFHAKSFFSASDGAVVINSPRSREGAIFGQVLSARAQHTVAPAAHVGKHIDIGE